MLLPLRRLHHVFDAGSRRATEKGENPLLLRRAGLAWRFVGSCGSGLRHAVDASMFMALLPRGCLLGMVFRGVLDFETSSLCMIVGSVLARRHDRRPHHPKPRNRRGEPNSWRAITKPHPRI